MNNMRGKHIRRDRKSDFPIFTDRPKYHGCGKLTYRDNKFGEVKYSCLAAAAGDRLMCVSSYDACMKYCVDRMVRL